MHVIYCGPYEAVDVDELDLLGLQRGEPVEVDDEVGARLLEQPGNWRQANATTVVDDPDDGRVVVFSPGPDAQPDPAVAPAQPAEPTGPPADAPPTVTMVADFDGSVTVPDGGTYPLRAGEPFEVAEQDADPVGRLAAQLDDGLSIVNLDERVEQAEELDLDSARKAELQQAARDLGLDDSGTVAQLRDRLAEHRAMTVSDGLAGEGAAVADEQDSPPASPDAD